MLSRQRFISWAPFLVPPLYLALIFSLQPANRLAHGDPWLGRLFYDDYDIAAYLLRSLNAERGRKAGGDEPAMVEAPQFVKELDSTAKRQDRYFLEYPHAALLLFRLHFLLSA